MRLLQIDSNMVVCLTLWFRYGHCECWLFGITKCICVLLEAKSVCGKITSRTKGFVTNPTFHVLRLTLLYVIHVYIYIYIYILFLIAGTLIVYH